MEVQVTWKAQRSLGDRSYLVAADARHKKRSTFPDFKLHYVKSHNF